MSRSSARELSDLFVIAYDAQFEDLRWLASLSLGELKEKQTIEIDSYEKDGLPSALSVESDVRGMLMFAHGDGEYFAYERDDNLREYFSAGWWGISDLGFDVYAIGCYSFTPFESYSLNGRLRSYTGYQCSVSFFAGNRGAAEVVREFVKGLSRVFYESCPSDGTQKTTEVLSNHYVSAIEALKSNYSAVRGDRINLLYLEEQLEGLEERK